MQTSKIDFHGETCHACLLRQSVKLASRIIPDTSKRRDLIGEIEGMLLNAFEAEDIWGIHHDIYATIYSAAGDPDPFLEIKQQSTREMLALYPTLKEQIALSEDPLDLAVRYAIVGNVIDFAVPHMLDLKHELESVSDRPLAINHIGELRRQLSQAESLLYLGDNAGETVLDRLLIETIGLPTHFVVREAPVINDATEDDAREAGLHQVATLVSSGSAHAGTVLRDCTDEVQALFADAPIIISKGMGNFESLMDQTRAIFFLLKVKCDVVANHLHANVGDSILLAANG